jgi:hypothetical protein
MLTCSVKICYTGTCAIGYLNFPTRIYGPIVILLTEITGVVTFAATALVAVIIVLVTLR